MTVRITIVGLGQIGASIGLALADQSELIHRTGHDREMEIAREAEKAGAVDRIEKNLIKAVSDANLVVLSLPVDQIYETMEFIAPELQEGAVVVDTGPNKQVVEAWAQELLPKGRQYVGLTPVINPLYLHDADSGFAAAHEDLFRGSLMALVAPSRTTAEAIKPVSDLVRLLGATILFTDPLEIDGLMAATHLLPQVMAAGLLNATIDQPGWREGRKVAGKAYAEATGPIVHLDETQTLKASLMLNRENVLRVLDSSIAALQAIRGDLDKQDEGALEGRLERARQGRMKWWFEREAGDWVGSEGPVVQLPDTPGILGRLFGGRGSSKSKK